MKVSVITLHNVKNYGSVLQTLATQKIFEELGCEVEFVDYWRKECLEANIMKNHVAHDVFPKRQIKEIIHYPTVKKQIKLFNSFLNKNVQISPVSYYSIEELRSNPPSADVLCVGSDQVWNSEWNAGFLPAYFLDYGPKETKRIAYSASIGKSVIDDWEKPLFRKYLSGFESISVREESARNLLEEVGIDSVVVADPTISIGRHFWKTFESACPVGDDYVLIYQLYRNPRFDEYAAAFAKKLGCKLVRICLCYEQLRFPGKGIVLPEVEAFVSLIDNARYVLTDSFHGTAFSAMMNTEYVCVFPNRFSSRLENILTKTSTENRRLRSYDDFSFIDNPIDFALVNEFLDNSGKEARDFLKRSLYSPQGD